MSEIPPTEQPPIPVSQPGSDRATLEEAIGPQYQIIRLLGQGGMGVVYLARELALDRVVAIKVLHPDAAASADARERFRREARIAANLTHPNIVPLYAFGEAKGMMYFVMGYVEGESLADRMARAGRLPPHEVRAIVASVAGALEHAHGKGVIHRDVKPDNILVDSESGQPLLTDFGIAKPTARGQTVTQRGVRIGTPLYMSPEQLSGQHPIDARSDLYSLGVVAYEMVAGRMPFDGETLDDVLVQRLSIEPRPLSVTAPDVPADLARVVMRCLARETSERWQNCSRLREALANIEAADQSVVERRDWIDGLLVGVVAPLVWLFLLVPPQIEILLEEPQTVSELEGLFSYYFYSTWVQALLAWAAVGAALLTGGVVYGHVKGTRWTDVVRMAFRQPRWWRGWYPAPLRHPATGPTWSRLPRGLRVLHTLYDVTAVSVLVMYLPLAAIYGGTEWPFLGQVWVWQAPAWSVTWTVIAYACILGYLAGLLWAMRQGLTLREADVLVGGLALGPTHEALAFWSKPHAARLLASVPSERAPPPDVPESLAEYLAQITDAARQAFDPEQQLGTEVTEAAQKLVAAITTIDEEIERLEDDADPNEIARVERRLARFEEDPTRRSLAHQKLSTLLADQLTVMRALTTEADDARSRREQFHALLGKLWREVHHMARRSDEATAAQAGSTTKIRALCEAVLQQT